MPDDARFADGFLDDFFAESEEHLVAIRRNLLALEAALPRGAASPSTLEEMFRSFHSLKGISGMVALDKAEVLAHDMESYLRALRQGDVPLSLAGVEALIDGTRLLDEIIAERRHRRPGPDIEPIRARLAALVPARPAQTASSRTGRAARSQPPVAPRQEAAAPPTSAPSTEPASESAGETAPASPFATVSGPASGRRRVTFVPSNDLLARGLNVNVIRERLRTIGEIVEARPKITGSGGIAFEFVVATDAGPDVFDAWRDDGVTSEPVAANGEEEAADRPAEGAADTAQPASRRETRAAAGSRVVRVDLARLDNVMSIVADIVVTRGRLDQTIEQLEDRLPHGDWRALQENNETLERQMRRLRDAVMRVRLVQVGEIFSKMPFVVRDLARDAERQVRLEVRGQDTEIDKFLIERMMDPIIHLVRNAISHGIEPRDERMARGKPPIATIGLHAATVGEWVVIEVEDDGRGIDRAHVGERARAAGLDVPATVDDATLLDLLCTPGFSTRDEADRTAGRGVGMAVVKQAVEQLSGTLELHTAVGRGSCFVMTLPVTLAILDALICRVGGQRFAVPQAAVREVLEVAVGDLRALERNELFPYRGATLPLVRVADLLGLDRAVAGGRLHVFVIGTGLQAVGLGVDRILGQREIVVRALADPLMRIEGLSGATELGDAEPVLILDPAALVRIARRERGTANAAVPRS